MAGKSFARLRTNADPAFEHSQEDFIFSVFMFSFWFGRDI